MTDKKRPRAFHLFSGVGGMSLGFEQAGFHVVAAIDSDQINVETHSQNFPDCKTINGDLSKLSGNDLLSLTELEEEPIHVLFGGSPCQGFSLMGKRQADDPRNTLLYDFARLVRELHPYYFVLENVVGLLSGETVSFCESFLRRVKRAGYSVLEPVPQLNASDFGVPQTRRRVFIIGHLKDLPAPHMNGTDKTTNTNNCPNVWDAIGDLHDIEVSEELFTNDSYSGELGTASDYAKVLRGEARDPQDRSHNHRRRRRTLTGCLRTTHTHETISRFTNTQPGDYEPISKFYRLKKDGLAPTIRAGTGKDHGSFMAARPIHPVDPRCITVREAARLHSFPDWFKFHPTRWHGFRQVGNSVPPLLARAVASSVYSAILESED